jgi:3-hydroxyisobutyrate dehydrogenase-like beta-hydroxyacid dehydrogenase
VSTPKKLAAPGAVTRRGHSSIPPALGKPTTKGMVAFLGLGGMGRAMAARLVTSGLSVRVWNRTSGPERALAKLGATTASTPRQCAEGADVVITMLSDAEALAAVLEGRDGVLAAFAQAQPQRRHRPVLVDMSTVGRKAAITAGHRAEEHGARFVDAPVSGSVRPAGKGELVALVGGTLRSVERVRPVLDLLCKKVIHAGGVGQGQALKVVLNGLGAHHLVAFTSMLALGERGGLARDVLLDAFTMGAFSTPSYVGKRDKVQARDYSPDFSLALALKDCGLNRAFQEEVGLELPVHRAITQDIASGVREGLGDLDLFALEKHYTR